ncbi:MAG TPA: hypothetical protein VMQ76_10700 [Terracidiphilus sp.]|nr:hypothetical protein [Terracidiphilus sp.]
MGRELEGVGMNGSALELFPSPSLSIGDNSTVSKELMTGTLPGSKKKQAECIYQNIAYAVACWGAERVGFLTLTVGDWMPDASRPSGRRFDKLHDRKEASRRFNSLLTHFIKRRYRCGIIVTERHKDGALHFHLVIVLESDIRTGIDMKACFPTRDKAGNDLWEPDYSTRPEALGREWALWRERAECYGFGRANLQPMKGSAEALGRYTGKYVSKAWEYRCDDDKGGRVVRYFGDWKRSRPFTPWEPARAPRKPCASRKKKSAKESPPPAPEPGPEPEIGELKDRPMRAPWSFRHGTMAPGARCWRECARQAAVSCTLQGKPIEEVTVKACTGRHWAWHWTHLFMATIFLLPRRACRDLRRGLVDHNRRAAKLCREKGFEPTPVWERGAGDWLGNHESGAPECRPLEAPNPWHEEDVWHWERDKLLREVREEFMAESAN